MTTRLYEPGNTLGNHITDYCGLHPHHIGLPRGCLDEAIELLRSNGANEEVEDERHVGRPLDVKFLGTLHDVQTAAVAAIEPHEHGVLAATTAFGKTVRGCPDDRGARRQHAQAIEVIGVVHGARNR